MRIEKCSYIKTNNIPKRPAITFKHSGEMQSLKNINIGTAPDGFIGKIRVRNAQNTECLLNIFKKSLGDGYENYSVRNDNGDIIGATILNARKFINYDRLQYQSDPSHVFICELFNYSNPKTPYYKNTEQYKDVGIRLLQIALKRSYEALCDGNLKLVSKNESKEWYKNAIGMTEEFPVAVGKYGFCIHNPNSMILPAEAKERLANLHGGL